MSYRVFQRVFAAVARTYLHAVSVVVVRAFCLVRTSRRHPKTSAASMDVAATACAVPVAVVLYTKRHASGFAKLMD